MAPAARVSICHRNLGPSPGRLSWFEAAGSFRQYRIIALNFRHNPMLFDGSAFPIAKVLGQGAAGRHFVLRLGFGGQPGRGSLLSLAMRIELGSEYLNVRQSRPPKLPKYITNEDMLNDSRINSRMRELSLYHYSTQQG
jgi:hypothetical protein